MSERKTTAEEHAETIREFVLAQEEPSDFVLSALAAMEVQIKALADALERRCVEHRKECNCGGCAALRLAGRL